MNIPARVIVRDLGFLAATIACWIWMRELQAQPATWFTSLLAILTAALTAFTGFLAHEWGHLTGAHLAGSAYEPSDGVFSIFLFKFNSDRNTRRQFLWMSNGGFLVSALVVVLLFAVLSFHRLADQLALGLTTLGVIATFILEVPAAWKVYKGGEIPRGAAYSSN
jgi:hypothetical protein